MPGALQPLGDHRTPSQGHFMPLHPETVQVTLLSSASQPPKLHLGVGA